MRNVRFRAISNSPMPRCVELLPGLLRLLPLFTPVREPGAGVRRGGNLGPGGLQPGQGGEGPGPRPQDRQEDQQHRHRRP